MIMNTRNKTILLTIANRDCVKLLGNYDHISFDTKISFIGKCGCMCLSSFRLILEDGCTTCIFCKNVGQGLHVVENVLQHPDIQIRLRNAGKSLNYRNS